MMLWGTGTAGNQEVVDARSGLSSVFPKRLAQDRAVPHTHSIAAAESITKHKQQVISSFRSHISAPTGYRDRNKKELAWRRVSEVVGVSVEVCKKRWKNLRDTYEVLKILPPPHKRS
uniref:MADF domain-containing protein n=1 Tax=Knipowitschia caucasica TaxID=637954 RepID=A0AAV2L3E8_KNICA